MYGETYRATVELYYQGENVIFAFKKMERYNTSIGDKNLKVVSIEEERFYFSGRKMIRYLAGKREVKARTVEFEEGAYSIFEVSDQLQMLLSNKN